MINETLRKNINVDKLNSIPLFKKNKSKQQKTINQSSD